MRARIKALLGHTVQNYIRVKGKGVQMLELIYQLNYHHQQLTGQRPTGTSDTDTDAKP